MSTNLGPTEPVRQQVSRGDAHSIDQQSEPSPLSPWPAPPGATRSYHSMVKPNGSICNLDCAYCYYLYKKELLGTSSKFRISDEILETHIRQYIEGQDRDQVVFSWQGGEPKLLRIEFFEKVIEPEQKWKKPGQRIENDLQTNGTLLNDDWGAFLKQHGFLVGLSINGPEELHDQYRIPFAPGCHAIRREQEPAFRYGLFSFAHFPLRSLSINRCLSTTATFLAHLHLPCVCLHPIV